ncbi:MAG TPA: thiamine diphosphokinase [Chthonomonadaceae bacterium]|nr:thiamine diphosphokinase [Chthonomonadaceae bacterium]
MRALIIANGEPPSAETARAAAEGADLVIATDGAAHKAAALGLAPDVICGDFDSLDRAIAEHAFPEAEFLALPDQSLADLEKALRLARERGATEATFLGAGGGRVDHALTAVALLLRYASELPLTLLHDGSAVRAVAGGAAAPGRLSLRTRPGDTISLIAFDGHNRVTLTGVRWPLDGAALPVGTHGVSNVAAADVVDVQVTAGAIVVCHLWG